MGTKFIVASLFCLLLIVSPFYVSAQTDALRVNTPNPNFRTIQEITPSDYVRTGINILLGGAGILSMIFLLIGGLRWITAGGDKDQTEKSRKIIFQAFTGLAIVFSAYLILFLFRVFFNIDLIQAPISRLGALSSDVGNPATYSGTSYACPGCTTTIPPAAGACPCGGPAGDGLCAANGTTASIGYYGACYTCTAGLWVATGATGCAPISCGACN